MAILKKTMGTKYIYMTESGYNKLKSDLEQLRSVERPAITAQIADARDKGDLSENAEYDAAKEAQDLLEIRIATMESQMAKARILDESKIETGKVQILSTVRLRNLNTKKEVEYMIVSESEANLKEGKLAIGTPIGKAILGKKIGDLVEVNAPVGVINFEILNIS